eukprot:TRINITY_DN10015_c0_g1_i6.p1 TRINITY_DN10015_c0_g1~~TRINITY_DN10015_c0_g1_i6.p1  ORF type:complete len:101 (-),score=9.45 TRINITY_DN10015_c0_g1_i6:10-312(-)
MGNFCMGGQSSRIGRVVDESAPVSFTGDEWEKSFPPITRAELQKKREEFWDTRVEGRSEMWQALRMASECEDDVTARSITEIGRAVQQECRDRSRMPSSA